MSASGDRTLRPPPHNAAAAPNRDMEIRFNFRLLIQLRNSYLVYAV